MVDYTGVIKKIIEIEQDNFGPVALEHARNVDGVEINENGSVELTEDNQEEILLDLVQEYHRLVGEAVSAALQEEEIDDPDLVENLQQYFNRNQESEE